MNRIITLLAVLFVCGCTLPGAQQPMKYVCAGGQLVDDPADCAPATTTSSTEPPQTTTTSSSTSTTATTAQAAPTTLQQSTTTSTLCEDAFHGYLLVDDMEPRCHEGYQFKIDADDWNFAATREGGKLGLYVAKPGGQIVKAVARLQFDGSLSAQVDGLTVEVVCGRENLPQDKPNHVALLRFT
jgi:hypothetical protein